MIEFGDLFNAKSNPVKNPVYKPLEKELKSLFNEFSKENANNFRKHIDSDKQVDYDERIHQYYSALPDSSDLKDELVSFFKNEGIIKSGRTHLQDAVPIGFWQEISGWRTLLFLHLLMFYPCLISI